jgi:hypothetical protein
MTIKQDLKQLTWYTFLLVVFSVAVGTFYPAWRIACFLVATAGVGMFAYTGLGLIKVERLVQSALYRQEQGYVPLEEDENDG